MKKYGSKHEIYQDYDLAIKLIIEGGVSSNYYDRIFDAFRRDDRVKIEQLTERVKNVGNQGESSQSVGFFVEVPAYGDAKDIIGAQFILLEHETGPEFFIHSVINSQFMHNLLLIAVSASMYVGPKIVDALYSKFQDVVFKNIDEKAGELWRELKGGAKISAVEIRTEHKGVGRLRFSEFDIDQIKCLLNAFKAHPKKNIFDFNQQCFGGALVEASSPV